MRWWIRIVAVWATCALAGKAAESQFISDLPPITDLIVDTWRTEEGLPENTVSSIAQTKDGYLWIGTFNGLARFDGVRFKVFGQAEGLPSGRITRLHAGADGSLWIGTELDGAIRYADGKFRQFSMADGLANNTVAAFVEEAGVVWIGTNDGLSRWDGQRMASFRENFGDGKSRVSTLALNPSGGLWVSTFFGLWVFDGTRFEKHSVTPEVDAVFILSFAQDAQGRLWLGTLPQGLFVWDGTHIVARHFHPGRDPNQVVFGPNGELWVGMSGAQGGVVRIGPDGRVELLHVAQGLSHHDVRSMMMDSAGNIWVGTTGGGLNRLRKKKIEIIAPGEIFMSVSEGLDGKILAAVNCGTASSFSTGPERAREILRPWGCIWSVLQTRDGLMCLGTYGEGLIRMANGNSEKLTPRTPTSAVVLSLLEDSGGGFWVGTGEHGLFTFENGNFVEQLTPSDAAGRQVTSLVEDREKTIWAGTRAGLYRRKDRQFEKVTLPGDGRDSIETIFAGKDAVWVAANGGRLFRFRGANVDCIGPTEGLIEPSGLIGQMVEDDAGFLWCGSNRGILRLRKSDFDDVTSGRAKRVRPRVFGKADGLAGTQCTSGYAPAGLRARDGRLYFGTIQGIAVIDPAAMKIDENPPRALIEEVLADGEPQAPGTAVRPGVDRLDIRFTGLSPNLPEKISFQYRLIGFEQDWIDADASRVAHFTGLAPGQYRFEARAANADGVWTPQPANMEFQVLPFFWQTWWFRALLGAGVVAVVGLGVRVVTVNRLQRQFERLEAERALERERARIARNMHDDLGASLTQITLLGELARRDAPRPDQVRVHAGRIAEVSRELVQAMDEIVWAVNPKNDSVARLAGYIFQYAQQFLETADLRYRIDIPHDLADGPLRAEQRHSLFLVVKEALNNIVKHANATEVQLSLRREGSELRIQICDNGRGFIVPASADGDGLGNMRRRIEELGGRFELKSEPARGSEIRIEVGI